MKLEKLLVNKVWILFFVISCNSESELLNNDEFIKAKKALVNKKSSKNDVHSLLFLIKNSIIHYELDDNNYNNEINSLLFNKNKLLVSGNYSKDSIDDYLRILWEENSINNKNLASTKKFDNIFLDSSILVGNVKYSNVKWSLLRHSKLYSFDEFCEYILPYRVSSENISYNWKKDASNKFNFNYAGKNEIDFIFEVSKVINEYIRKRWFHSYIYTNISNNRDLNRYEKYPFGICEQRLSYSLMLLRGNGIPSTVDYCPQWGNRSGGHDWLSIILPKGKFIPLNFGEDSIVNWTFKIPFSSDLACTVPKVYRRMFSIQDEKLFNFFTQGNEIHPKMLNFNSKDVTDLYQVVSDVFIDIPNLIDESIYYLCVFDNNEFVPVQASISNDKKKVIFTKVGRNILYSVCYYKNKGLVPISEPFIIDSSGTKYQINKFIPKLNCNVKNRIYRKYPESPRIQSFRKSLVGGVFWGIDINNNKLFLNKIDYIPSDTGNTIYINSNKLFKKIYFENLNNTISEIKINNNENKYTLWGDSSIIYCGFKNVFDNDILTYFEARTKRLSRVGVSFEKPVILKEIQYFPRNDGNSIIKGEGYDIFYWNNGWKLFNKFKTSRSFIDIIDSNRLFYVKKEGLSNENRPFYFNNKGNQTWL